MQDQFQKAIKLAKKTGDRLIVFDPAKSDLTYVIMALDEYERLAIKRSEVRGLTEDELLDKINRDIAIWKSEQDFDVDIDVSNIRNSIRDDFFSSKDIINSKLQGEFFDYRKAMAPNFYHGEKEEEFKNEPKASEVKSKWKIPSQRKQQAEEILDEDENTSYLEEITF